MSLISRILGGSPYTLFVREGGSFRVVERAGYRNPFVYAFLSDPDQWALALESGCQRVEGAEASLPGREVWVALDRPGNPGRLLVAELDFGSLVPGLLGGLLARSEVAHQQLWVSESLSELRSTRSPVLIVSEPGSGRDELIEAFVSDRFGDSRSAEFFHPGRLSGAVQARELFGDSAGVRLGGEGAVVPLVERGSSAIVIQEVAELRLPVQARLLDYLVRGGEPFWIFSTAQDLASLSEAGLFSAAFWAFLEPHRYTLPPLRKRKDLLESEIESTLESLRLRYGRRVQASPQAVQALVAYQWPGNRAELRATLEQAYLLSAGGSIREEELRLGSSSIEESDTLNLRRRTADLERRLLLEAYSLHGGNQVQMARALGISRGSLQYKLAKYGLQ